MDFEALRAALAVSPDNVPLLLLVGRMHEDRFELAEARDCMERVLVLEAGNAQALLGLARVLELAGETSQAVVRLEGLLHEHPEMAEAWLLKARLAADEGDGKEAKLAYERAVHLEAGLADDELKRAILELCGPRRVRVGAEGEVMPAADEALEGRDAVLARELGIDESLRQAVRFEHVGGMRRVKEEIRMKILLPLTHPELFAAYGKKAGGGVLLYGPPGCGKTMMARAAAGEIQANFFAVGLHQVLDMYLGESEQRLHQIFDLARRMAPSVLFFDEADALAADRRDLRQSAGRHLINQFLDELDGVKAVNEGVLIMGATNAPWHMDSAFLRPGRFDRVIFVPPPDLEAREEIVKIHAAAKPVVDWEPRDLAKRSEGLSGADLKLVFDLATEAALAEAMRHGKMVPVTGKMLMKAMKEVKASTMRWFDTAKNHAMYANQNGLYDDVLVYLGLKR